MRKPLVILDPGHGGLSSFFYDLDNGVKLTHTWAEVAALVLEERHYFSSLQAERWRRGERRLEPRFYFESKGRRITWGDSGNLSPLDPRVCEKDLVLDVARSLHRLLAVHLSVKLTRDRDGYVATASRAHFTNRACEKHGGPAVLVSLHAEADPDPKVCGFRIWRLPGRSERLAETLQAALSDHLDELGVEATQREVHEENLPLLGHVETPGVRVDLGFLSHLGDARRLLERQLRQELAGVLAMALLRHFERQAAGERPLVGELLPRGPSASPPGLEGFSEVGM